MPPIKIYQPAPIQTDGVQLSADLHALMEALAQHVHDLWALKRMAEGWRYGARRSDAEKTHPGLVAYGDLADSEKDYDRTTARETLRAILALGYCIIPPSPGSAVAMTSATPARDSAFLSDARSVSERTRSLPRETKGNLPVQRKSAR
jgi:RyR domain